MKAIFRMLVIFGLLASTARAEICSDLFTDAARVHGSANEIIAKTFGFNPTQGGIRLVGSFSNPPADPSIYGNEVVVWVRAQGELDISVRTRDYLEQDIDLGNGTVISKAGKANSILITSNDAVAATESGFTVETASGRSLKVEAVSVLDATAPSIRPTYFTMLMVTVTGADGSALSAYVMPNGLY